MASINLNPNPLLKPSSFSVGRKKNPSFNFKPSSFPISLNKNNKSKLNLCKTFSITDDKWLHTSLFQSKRRSKFIIAEQHPSKEKYRDFSYVVVSIDKEDLEPRLLNKIDSPDRVYLPHESCNGLILLLYDGIWSSDPEIAKEALWNPTTNELKILPTSPASLDPRYETSNHNYFGFGYDSTTDDYKVIRFLMKRSNLRCSLAVAELYSLKTNSWKRVNFRPYTFHPCGDPFMKINANGTYYWLNNVNHNVDRNFIQSFNFVTEKFESYRVPMPPREKLEKFCHKRLVEYCGSLGLLASTCVLVDDVKHYGLQLWVWDDVSLSWSLESTFIVDKMRSFMGLFENDKLFYRQPGGDLTVQDCAMDTVMNISNVCTHKVNIVFPFVENYVSLSSHGK
ncbi:F-box family protein [Striga asiatica]|uniref:F-box family protein n=1 Tax=Striga asiatica TaxID=4170 RepID=A0A5A7R6H5_STRAF|nr:F-box family protein [Striga asiatica]